MQRQTWAFKKIVFTTLGEQKKQNKTKQKKTNSKCPFLLNSIKAESLLDDQSKLLYKKLSKLSQIL